MSTQERPWSGNGARPDREREDSILALWDAGERNKTEIARRIGCPRQTVQGALKRRGRAGPSLPAPEPVKPAARTCQRPDVGNGLLPCGRPLHEIGGETLGVCKMHWDTGAPVSGQKYQRPYPW